MKKLFLLPLFAALLLFACNSSESTDEESEETEETTDNSADDESGSDEEMHMDDDGHSHGDDMTGMDEMPADSLSYDYTAAYVCPMHCDGSGSEEAGTCPVCGMDLVANEN